MKREVSCVPIEGVGTPASCVGLRTEPPALSTTRMDAVQRGTGGLPIEKAARAEGTASTISTKTGRYEISHTDWRPSRIWQACHEIERVSAQQSGALRSQKPEGYSSPLYAPPSGFWGLLSLPRRPVLRRMDGIRWNVRRTSVPLLACALAIVATTTLAAVFTDLFGRDRRLNEKDLKLLQASLLQVLEARSPGARSTWDDAESGEGGRALVLRIYERGGMPCAEVEHLFTARNPYRYVLPFCRKDGQWKMAF
jgi:hypothetical protein